MCDTKYAVASRLQELALSLALKCLSFDFVGTSIDESSEEFGTVQVSLKHFLNCAPLLAFSCLKVSHWALFANNQVYGGNLTDSIILEASIGGFFNTSDIF